MNRRTPSNPSAMPHQFGIVPNVSAPRSTFRRDHGHKTTLNAGYLVPYYIEEILPGDTLNLNSTILARLSTPTAPVMDNLFIDTQFFFVPNRLLWDNWERFNGAQDNPGDSTDFLTPMLTCPVGGWAVDSLPAYFGVRQGTPGLDIVAFHSRAYNLIYNECFRDQDLQDAIPFDTDDGPDLDTDYVLRRRCKRPDYFTTCRPFVQKGPDVPLPLGDIAPVYGIGKINQAFGQSNTTVYETGGSATETYASSAIIDSALDGEKFHVEEDPNNAGYPGIYADLQNATASTVTALRFAFQLQRKRERDARSGTRYVEYLAAHWGVTSPDFRLQRPEYLGGGSQRMEFQQVPNTNIDATKPADLGAYALSVHSGHGFTKSFVEHGVVIGLVSVRADLSYQQGVPRMLSRRTVDDFYLPVYAHLSEQAVFNKEIYATGTATDDEIFGYQEFGAEYRYGITKSTGMFNSDYATPLDFWHLSLDFDDTPVLGDVFIEDNPPVDRVLQVGSGAGAPQVIMDTYQRIRHTREMPVYSVPGLIDHF